MHNIIRDVNINNKYLGQTNIQVTPTPVSKECRDGSSGEVRGSGPQTYFFININIVY